MTIPRIISVDDHVVEPPDLWSNRLPSKYLDRGPRVVRERGRFDLTGLGWVQDDNGDWAKSGRLDESLLAAFRAEPYFARNPPKSTGRDLFDPSWLTAKLGGHARDPADVQATLVALTARTIADAIRTHCEGATEVLVCGGGANNGAIMSALAALLSPREVTTTAMHGVAVEHVEALAFAWLARECLAGRPGNLPAVTGARGLRVLGAIYPR